MGLDEDIDEGAKRYDYYTELQRKQQESSNIPFSYDLFEDTYDAIEADLLDHIRALGFEVGCFSKVRQTFREDSEIEQYCRFYINLANADMEAYLAEIEDCRKKRKEYRESHTI